MGPQSFSETNMLVSAIQKSPLGVLPNARPQSKGVCIVVEYRLYSLESKNIKIEKKYPCSAITLIVYTSAQLLIKELPYHRLRPIFTCLICHWLTALFSRFPSTDLIGRFISKMAFHKISARIG